MTTTLPRNLDLTTLTYDQLGSVYATYAERAADTARTGRARNCAMWARQRVTAEADRRGAVIRRLHDGTYAVGHEADFVPSERAA